MPSQLRELRRNRIGADWLTSGVEVETTELRHRQLLDQRTGFGKGFEPGLLANY